MPGRRESTEFTERLSFAQHAAATATEERTIFSAPCACRVRAFTIVSDIAVTGDNTNTTNLNVKNKGASGAGTTVVAALPLPTGVNLVAFDETAIPLSSGATFTMIEGDTLTLEFVKVGTGVAIGPGMVTLDWEPL